MRKKRTVKEIKKAIKESYSYSQSLRKLGIPCGGGNFTTIKKWIKMYDINISHFTHSLWSKGKKLGPNLKRRIALDKILVQNSTYTNTLNIKIRIIEAGLKEFKCENCEKKEWLERKIPLELHHVNGDKFDNRIENLQILCPNCHALTENYRGRNIK